MCRVARVLSLQRGHFMLVGVGGSGKKSITTLASALAGCELDTIETKKQYSKKEFKEDLLRMMKKVGIENKVIYKNSFKWIYFSKLLNNNRDSLSYFQIHKFFKKVSQKM